MAALELDPSRPPMFSASTYQSLAAQMARLVPSPSGRLQDRARPAAPGGGGGCGSCPICREFVRVDFPGPGATAPCPSCRRPIDHVEPLGPA